MSDRLRAYEYDITATIRFKDVTYDFEEQEARNDLKNALTELLLDEMDWLNYPPSFGGFTVEVVVSNPRDITDDAVPPAEE